MWPIVRSGPVTSRGSAERRHWEKLPLDAQSTNGVFWVGNSRSGRLYGMMTPVSSNFSPRAALPGPDHFRPLRCTIRDFVLESGSTTSHEAIWIAIRRIRM